VADALLYSTVDTDALYHQRPDEAQADGMSCPANHVTAEAGYTFLLTGSPICIADLGPAAESA